jgi:hypothetical protein
VVAVQALARRGQGLGGHRVQGGHVAAGLGGHPADRGHPPGPAQRRLGVALAGLGLAQHGLGPVSWRAPLSAIWRLCRRSPSQAAFMSRKACAQ